MSQIVFRNVNKNLVFTISSIPFDEYSGKQATSRTDIPLPNLADVDKVLSVDEHGFLKWRNADYSSVEIKHMTIHGAAGSPISNFNAMPAPLNVYPGELWFVTDSESGTTYIWGGGQGKFGPRFGGQDIKEGDLISLMGTALGSGSRFATKPEARAGANAKVKLSPVSAGYLDIDGGIYQP